MPPTGTEIAIEVRWKDKQGKVQSCPAQEWIRNRQTKKAWMRTWVFAGSILYKDKETGKESFLANGGDFISVLNNPTATLDLPIRSESDPDSRSFEAFVEHMPPAGTPVTIVLKPNLEKPAAK